MYSAFTVIQFTIDDVGSLYPLRFANIIQFGILRPVCVRHRKANSQVNTLLCPSIAQSMSGNLGPHTITPKGSLVCPELPI